MAVQEQQSSWQSSSTQEMTICRYNLSDRFMCTTNKKLYPYSGSSAIYTIANTAHESVTHMPSIGWKGGTFPGKLGNVDQRSVGITNRGWLPARTVETPCQTSYPHPMMVSKEEQAQITIEVVGLLAKGAIQETQLLPESFVSQIFLVEKKDGGQRPVVNLKCLNRFMRVEHFKMEGLHLLPDLIQAGDWMIKLDLKDVYLQVPIHPDHQKFLVFGWNNRFYQFKCLPFGLSTAPRVFTKLLRPVVGFLRHIGCSLIIYLDDILFLHQDKDQLSKISQLVCQLFQCLGLSINDKSPC